MLYDLIYPFFPTTPICSFLVVFSQQAIYRQCLGSFWESSVMPAFTQQPCSQTSILFPPVGSEKNSRDGLCQILKFKQNTQWVILWPLLHALQFSLDPLLLFRSWTWPKSTLSVLWISARICQKSSKSDGNFGVKAFKSVVPARLSLKELSFKKKCSVRTVGWKRIWLSEVD